MFSTLQLDPPARRHFLRRAAIAPLCLCLVAGLHAVRVVTSNQTPWKGGGFGMFSTVDSESARLVRAFAVTEQGDLPLVIPPQLETRVGELRAAPTAAAAQDLAGKLAGLNWQRPDLLQIGQGQQIAASTKGQPITSALLRPAVSESNTPLPQIGLPRGLEAVTADEDAAGAIRVRSIRLEVWRLTFDRHRAVLASEQLFAVTSNSLLNPEPRTPSPPRDRL